LAFLIDPGVMAVAEFVILGALIALMPVLGFIYNGIFMTVLRIAIPLMYFSYFESSDRQATLGKTSVGLIVTSTEGRKITFLNALERNICKSFSALILGLGFLMILFTPKKQGLHDILSGCLVMKKTAGYKEKVSDILNSSYSPETYQNNTKSW